MTNTATSAESHRVAAEELRQFVEQLERIDADKSDLAETRKEKVAEIKGAGYDVKAVAAILKRRKMDRDALAEQDALLGMYQEALGM